MSILCDCGHGWHQHDASGCWYEYDHGAGIECDCRKTEPVNAEWVRTSFDVERSPAEPATAEQIIAHFYSMDWVKRISCNWGTDSERPSIWEVPNTTSYINGVMVTMDFDFDMAFLLEVCDRDGKPTWVRHLMFYSARLISMPVDKSQWCSHERYPFFESTITDLQLHVEFANWVDTTRKELREK